MTARRVRRILLYGTSRTLTEGLLGLRGLVLAALLGPEAFGLWALLRLSMHYASFSEFGIHRGMEYETARNPPEEREIWARTSSGFLALVFGLVATISLAGSFLVRDPRLVGGMRVFALAVLLEQLYIYGQVYLRASGSLKRYAVNELTSAALHLGLAGGLSLVWGLSGAYAGLLVASLISAVLAVRTIPLRPRLDPARLRRLLQVGFPVGLTLMLGMSMATADRLVVGAYGGTRMLGIYAFGVAFSGLAVSLGWVVRTVVLPDVYRDAQGDERHRAIRDHMETTVLPFAWLLPPVLGVGALAVGPVVVGLAAQYEEAIAPARWIVFTGVTSGFTTLGTLGVVAGGRQRVLPLLSLAGLVVNAALALLALRFGLGLEGVAGGALATRIGTSSGVLLLAAGAAGLASPRSFTLRAILPMIWCSIAVAIAARLAPGYDPAAALRQLGLYGLFVLPLAPGIVGRTRGLLALAD